MVTILTILHHATSKLEELAIGCQNMLPPFLLSKFTNETKQSSVFELTNSTIFF